MGERGCLDELSLATTPHFHSVSYFDGIDKILRLEEECANSEWADQAMLLSSFRLQKRLSILQIEDLL